jgi:hypothetical protein
LINHKNIFIIDLNEIGIPGEPEGIAWYKDHLVITIRGGQVYNVYFVKTITVMADIVMVAVSILITLNLTSIQFASILALLMKKK